MDNQKKAKKNTAPILHYDGSWSDPWTQVSENMNRAIIIAGNGVLQLKRIKALEYTLAEAATLIASGGIDFLSAFTPYCRVSVPDKIPMNDVRKVQSFFRDVTDQKKIEAAIFCLWSPIDRSFQFVAPKKYEDMSKTHITSVFPDLPMGYVLFARFHSHVDFAASHSSEDDYGEKTDGFYITIGNNGSDHVPTYACSVVVDGKRCSLRPDQIIDGLETVEYPNEWMAPVTEYEAEQARIEEQRRKAREAEERRKKTHPSFSFGDALINEGR